MAWLIEEAVAQRRKTRKRSTGMMRTVRKPVPPPMRVEKSIKEYRRELEKERLRREEESDE